MAAVATIIYIACGMLIYHYIEEWTTVCSVYFCFVTMSTIGFGDYVPGFLHSNAIENVLVRNR